MAVRFDASGDALTATGNLPGTTYTVTLWVMLSADRNTWSVIYDMPSTTGANASDWQYLGTTNDGTGLMFAQFPGTESAKYQLTVGAWHRVAVVRSGTSVTVYRGAATGSLTTTAVTVSNLTPAQLWIGRDSYADEWLNGRVAAFKMWSAALTATEVEAELGQYAPARTADLNRYYPFTAVPLTVDASGFGRNLTAGSSAVTLEDGPDIPAGGGTSGALTATAPPLTAAVAGTVSTAGPLAAAAAAVTTALAAVTRTAGAVQAVTLAPSVSLAAATSALGALAAATPAPVATATGTARTSGAVTAAAAGVTTTLAGLVRVAGDLHGEITAPVAAAAGVVANQAGLAATAAAPTVQVAGHTYTGGALTVELPALLGAGDGVVAGDADLTADAPTVAASFAAESRTGGAMVAATPAPGTAWSAAVTATGDLQAAVPAVTAGLVASGTAAQLTAVAPIGAVDVQVSVSTVGALDGMLSSPTVELVADLESPAALDAPLPGPQALLAGALVTAGFLDVQVPPPVGESTAGSDAFGDLDAEFAALTGALSAELWVDAALASMLPTPAAAVSDLRTAGSVRTPTEVIVAAGGVVVLVQPTAATVETVPRPVTVDVDIRGDVLIAPARGDVVLTF